MSLRTFISENGVYIFTKKTGSFFKKRKFAEIKRVSGRLRWSNIYDGQTFTMICIHYRSVNVGRE